MFQHISEILARDPDYLDRLINENEAAGFIGYTIRALQGWRVKGGGPKFVKVSARSIRYQLLTEEINAQIGKLKKGTRKTSLFERMTRTGIFTGIPPYPRRKGEKFTILKV
jgi:hypothetical protein